MEMIWQKNYKILFLIFFLVSCFNEKKKIIKKSPRIKSLVNLIKPNSNDIIYFNDSIDIEFAPKDNSSIIKKFYVIYKNDTIDYFENEIGRISSSKFNSVGKHRIKLICYINNDKKETYYSSINLFPNNNPNKLKFKIKNIFPHDTDAYTQGLTFDKNRFFESTGRRGFSSLKEVELKSGKTIKKIDLDNKYFGEGITVFNDKIYQLTWEANLGFVYDKNSFEKIDQFKYNHEGWGITTYDNKLLISDGTETIYFIDPESYKLIKKIQVYNKNGPIKLINELENVKGKIFANIYGKEEIIIFDPETGIVESILDLNGIFNKKNYNKKFDVLNGVAYNSITNQLFVTGKLWPSIFEIEIIN